MLAAIGRNFARVAHFAGRENRAHFWPYVAVLIGLATFAMAAVMLPSMLQTMARMQRFAAEHPEQAHVEQGPGHYSITIEGSHPELMPDMSGMLVGFAVIILLFVLLVAAAVVRRLHDREKSGLWGLLPLPFLCAGLGLSGAVFRSFAGPEPAFGYFGLLLANNLIYLGLLAWLVVLLAGPGTPGPNRYGPEPARLP